MVIYIAEEYVKSIHDLYVGSCKEVHIARRKCRWEHYIKMAIKEIMGF
jgi:hypothetical protein